MPWIWLLLLLLVSLLPLLDATFDAKLSTVNISRYIYDNRRELDSFFVKTKQCRFRSLCTDEYVKLGPSRIIRAKATEEDDHTVLNVETGPFGLHRIRGKERKYLCFNRRGRLILRRNPKPSSCIFRYLSDNRTTSIILATRETQKWAVGFRKNGKPFSGHKYNTKSKRRRCFKFIVATIRQTNLTTPYSPINIKNLKQFIFKQSKTPTKERE